MRTLDAHTFDAIKSEEGLRLDAYQDTEGVWTIGYGTNLQTLTIDRELAERWLREKCEDLYDGLTRVEGFLQANGVRQGVLLSMAYQLGLSGLVDGFPIMWGCVGRGDWDGAAEAALDSRVAREQAPERWQRHALRLRSGEWRT